MSYSELTSNGFWSMADKLKDLKSEEETKKLHVFISGGNDKTGALVPSVSLRPFWDCSNDDKCHKGCYDLRHCCRFKEVIESRINNASIYKWDRERYFREISDFCYGTRFFRWHIGGDIRGFEYLEGMEKVAEENPHCQFLCFTKNFYIVNNRLQFMRKFPENLKIIFSEWKDLKVDNPFKVIALYVLKHVQDVGP